MCLGLLPQLASRTAEPAASRPNIIILLADDMRWDAMSCAGHPFLNTPNLDRLARGGTRFSNAFVTTSICCVSRASILTGQYARRHGVHDFKTPVDDLETMYPMLLQRAGNKSADGGNWEQVTFPAARLAALDQNAIYTLDAIDARNYSWGWFNFDSVRIPGVLVPPPARPAPVAGRWLWNAPV